MIIEANKVDSATFKQSKRAAYLKLTAYIELLTASNCLNKLNKEQTDKLIQYFMQLLTDDKLQKFAVQGLLKVSKKQNFTVKLPKYNKLLEGLCDDIKFRDMISAITFGSQTTVTIASLEDDQLNDDNNLDEEELPVESKKKQKKEKESIPKLAKEDRAEVLPVIVRLLFSKLMQNKKLK